VRAGQFISVSGTAPVADDGSLYGEGNAYLQAKRCIEIIAAALAGLGADLEHVVRTRMFVTDITQWDEIGRAHAEAFREIRPATSMVEVSRLIDPGMLVEIEADAILPD
jgi:enamine deaminase RidA (YjgF/YER057c/UK114 family)